MERETNSYQAPFIDYNIPPLGMDIKEYLK